MTDANTLTPCPFCGERAETYFIPERHSYQIECSDVFGCTARVTRDSEEAAIEAWNLRAPAPAPAPTDAELMQVIKDVAKNSAINRDGSTSLRIARAVLAKWGAPAPALASQPAAPAQAREPLTDEQIDEIHLANSNAYERGDVEYESHGFARAIEQAHGIKATNPESNK